MLSIHNGYERLGQHYLAEISKTLTSPGGLCELLDAVMKKIVTVVEQDGYFSAPPRRIFADEMPGVAITLDAFLRRTPFAALLSKILKLLDKHYHSQDWMEAWIFPVSVPIDQPGTVFNRDFFSKTTNKLQGLVETSESLAGCLRPIEVASYRPGQPLELIMDGEKGEAVAFLSPNK